MSVVRVTTNPTIIRVYQTPTPVVRIASVGLQGPAGPRLVEIVMSIGGNVVPSESYAVYLASANVTAIPADVVAVALTANTVDTTITFRLNDSTIVGTVVFAAGQTVATCSFNDFDMVPGDFLTMYTDGAVVGLADMVITLPVNRGN